ncbi:MAG: hypothetical protein WBA29_08180 [Xanthobacteraceae bacterium]
MANQTPLNGSPTPVTIAPGGYSLEAPGLHGTITEMTPGESASRADGSTHEPRLLDALKNADC